MNQHTFLMALDQGTTSSRAIVFDTQGKIIARAQEEFPQLYPKNGWVEHNPEDIWQSTLRTAQQALAEAEQQGGKVIAIGITNQRETSLVWQRDSGEAIYNAIVWQDRRTAHACERLRQEGHEAFIRSRSGLLCDAYFSATKVSWILDNVAGARSAADAGSLAFGTVDSFLLWRLTGGKVHATDATNASRTNLYNIHHGQWDDELLKLFKVPRGVLPDVKNCADDFGVCEKEFFGREIPIFGVAGDQHAAMIGQACFAVGDTKSTYGTGCFALMNTGKKAVPSQHRLLTTIAYQLQGEVSYALEGSIFIAGAAVQWLRDELGIIKTAHETEALARSLAGNDGVVMVPAFTGLGAPYWNPDARGALVGLTRNSGRAHFARAALEAVCYQTSDLCQAMAADAGLPTCLRVDGGMVVNQWLMQFLADTLNLTIHRPQVSETTALGAAYLAGLYAGVYDSVEDIQKVWQLDREFLPSMPENVRTQNLAQWHTAVKKALAV